MATIADELLNDFEDSGSENDEAPSEDLFAGDGSAAENAPANGAPGHKQQQNGDMELEGDEEAAQDADADGAAPTHMKMEDAEDEAETKARVEKMELKAVNDVRSVAGLMRQLDPVIEVSHPYCIPVMRSSRLHLAWIAALTSPSRRRKLNTTRTCRQISRPRMWAASRTIPSTSS